jgi:hypothetical protein
VDVVMDVDSSDEEAVVMAATKASPHATRDDFCSPSFALSVLLRVPCQMLLVLPWLGLQ